MPYIGNQAGNRFVASKAASVYSGNGSTTAFTLEHSVGSDEDILVSVDGVIQEPSVAYAVSSGTTLTFTAAPSTNSGNNIFVYYLFRTVGTIDHPATSALTATSGTFSTDLTVDTSTLKVDSTNNRIGVGTASPSSSLHVRTADSSATAESNAAVIIEGTDATRADLQFLGDAGAFQAIYFGDNSDADIGRIAYSHSGNSMRFNANASERMRINSSGTVLIGKTANTSNVAGIELEATGTIVLNRASNTAMFINRTSNNGDYIEFRKDNGTRGKIGTDSDTSVYFACQRGSGIVISDDTVLPCNANGVAHDDVTSLGTGGNRFDNVFATNGSINTSDKNEKQDIEELTDAEKRVAVVAKGLMRKYRWKSRVAEKGDKARTHFGIIAQDLQDAFTAESLDASKYGMFCSDTWWEKEISVNAVEAKDAVYKEVTDEDGVKINELVSAEVEAKDAYTYRDTKQEATSGYTEKTRLGVRYSELLAFIISAI